MPFVDLPHDLLLLIFLSLDIPDILALKQTNRVLHACGSSDFLWHQLYRRLSVPLNVSADTDVTTLVGPELQQLILSALKLENNWRSSKPRVRRYTSIKCDTKHAIDEMHLLARANMLVTAQRTRRNGAPVASFKLWSLENFGEIYCASSLEVPGQYRKLAVSVDRDREEATFVVSTYANEQADSILQIYKARLIQHHESIYSTSSARKLRTFQHPDQAKGIIHDVAINGNLVAVKLIDTNAEFPGNSYQIFLINTETWTTQLLHPKFREPISRLNIKLAPNRIILIGATAETIVLREIALPACAVSTLERFQYKPTTAEEEDFIDNLGYLTECAISSCPNPVDSDTLVVHSTTAPEMLSLLFFDILHQDHGHGHLVRLFFGRKSNDFGCNEGSSDADTNGGTMVQGSDLTTSTGSRQDRQFPFPPESSVKLVRIGTTGRRAVWIENNLDSDESWLMRAHFPPEDPTAASVGILVPSVPVNPVLPFSPQACQSLAFDEIVGRLCCGTYNGFVYILDYN